MDFLFVDFFLLNLAPASMNIAFLVARCCAWSPLFYCSIKFVVQLGLLAKKLMKKLMVNKSRLIGITEVSHIWQSR